jgi:hypothetical protein
MAYIVVCLRKIKSEDMSFAKRFLGGLIILCCMVGLLNAVHATVVVTGGDGEVYGLMDEKQAERLQKRADRITAKVERKMEKHASKNEDAQQGYNLMDDDRFRLGALLVIAGLIASIILTSWLAWIGGLAVLAGLALMAIAILEY